MRQKFFEFWLDETGLELSEYALGAGFMAITIATVFGELGTSITNQLNALLGKIVT